MGAAGTVTGSKYLLQAFGKNILIDCGLFQGLKELRLLNWQPFPVDASSIDLILITHGHLDHVGYLPRLVKEGFKASVYDLKDVARTIPFFKSQVLDQWIKINDDIHVRFRYNGHIIGAAFIELKLGSKVIVFSGDIGRLNDPLLYPPARPDQANALIIESTYGDRIHPIDAEKHLAEIINRSIQRNGTIIIPSFAVERTQTLMYLLWQLKKQRAIKEIPVYMDSPMGRNVLEIFHHNTKWHRLFAEDCNEMCSSIVRVKTADETPRVR